MRCFLIFVPCYWRNSFLFLWAIVPDLDSLKISAIYFFLKSCAVNKNWLFLPFLLSEWIPPQVHPDWKRCWTQVNIATPWPQYWPDGRSGALKFWRHWFWWHATTTAFVPVPTCFEQHWFPLFYRHGISYMTRVSLLPSFTSLDSRERHLTDCSMLWFLPVTQCAGDTGGGPWSLLPDGMLGLLLCYLGSQMTIKWLCLIFGNAPMPYSRILKKSVYDCEAIALSSARENLVPG